MFSGLACWSVKLANVELCVVLCGEGCLHWIKQGRRRTSWPCSPTAHSYTLQSLVELSMTSSRQTRNIYDACCMHCPLWLPDTQHCLLPHAGLEGSAEGGEGMGIEAFRPMRNSVPLSPRMLLPQVWAEALGLGVQLSALCLSCYSSANLFFAMGGLGAAAMVASSNGCCRGGAAYISHAFQRTARNAMIICNHVHSYSHWQHALAHARLATACGSSGGC